MMNQGAKKAGYVSQPAATDPRSTEAWALSEASRREMFSTQTKINSSVSWGLGVGLQNYGGRQMFWHWGDNGNFKNFVIGNRAKKWAMVIFANARNGHKIWERIVREATGEDHASFLWV